MGAVEVVVYGGGGCRVYGGGGGMWCMGGMEVCWCMGWRGGMAWCMCGDGGEAPSVLIPGCTCSLASKGEWVAWWLESG
jgi:hypothetical protein